MKLTIKNQENYSRGELLLRSIFGPLYITLPHMFLLFFVGICGSILYFIAFLVVVFTGTYPKSFFEFQVQLMRWRLRLNARLLNLSDGYPAFGLSGTDDEYTQLEVPYPERIRNPKGVLTWLQEKKRWRSLIWIVNTVKKLQKN